ncbi:MAG: ribose 5-phosphate isomerase [Sphingomonas bacterium]|nr:ribose 5-phosphate isomerase [Sphingomonas bacterium]
MKSVRDSIMTQTDDKRLAAEAALAEIADGMAVGLGTGSTAAFAIAAIGRRRLSDWPNATFYATSRRTLLMARDAGVPIARFDSVAALDLAIDGVDEIDPAFRAIKGAGGAMLREKIVATAARRMVVIADGTKAVATLGKAPVPVETLPFARAFVADSVARLGAEPVLRLSENGRAYRTEQGNLVLDCRFGTIADPPALSAALSAIPGALGHGLFVDQVNAAYIAREGVVTRLARDDLTS